ncbi:hypothetical protein PtrSN002B_005558 [Pyrenophora tritici-repentis]|nr:hypothetical protein A1F94_000645 [Pyrenophora tritici-repentis]KAI1541755.1 hypothetical protein PtrSN001C_004410 [Pyrenophora tritici-repentis]KAI1551593.1 hypothetical protein PtrSN002B_005558 [Pyrenophora tritici-repentis]KAI1590603.1 hypothetical protein PtrEW13061_005295 [Pyrenophora tritici-repentis]KAI1603239.1 hypothetical protein PtrCC142_004590 [Pyrenophora tritici-repentis]
MPAGMKRRWQQGTSSDAAPPPKKRAPVRKAPSSPRPYKFDFGRHKGKTIEQVYATEPSYIEQYLIWGHWRGAHDHIGMVKMNERSSSLCYWEETDSAAVLSSHAGAKKLNLDDCKDIFDDSRFTKRFNPINLAFAATVIRIERRLSEFGNEGGDQITILPCGWPWGTVLSDDLFDLKITVGDLKDPETVEPKQGCCLRMIGKVLKVDGKKVDVCVKGDAGRIAKGWDKVVTVQLMDGVDDPEPDASYVFKGSLEPFMNVRTASIKAFPDVFKHIKFLVEICEKKSVKKEVQGR